MDTPKTVITTRAAVVPIKSVKGGKDEIKTLPREIFLNLTLPSH